MFAGHAKRRIVIALYNYTAREETDVSFVKGDRMEVLDDTESDWWRVIHLTTRQEGLIPWNFVAEERSVNSEEYVFFLCVRFPMGNFRMNYSSMSTVLLGIFFAYFSLKINKLFYLLIFNGKVGFSRMFRAKKPINYC